MDAELETKKIMRNAILHFSKERNEDVLKTQIRIFTENEECDGSYQILTNFNFGEAHDLNLKQLMLVPKIDFRGKGMLADLFVEPKIKSILKNLTKQYNEDSKNVSVIVGTNDVNCDELKLILTINQKPIKLIPFGDIF